MDSFLIVLFVSGAHSPVNRSLRHEQAEESLGDAVPHLRHQPLGLVEAVAQELVRVLVHGQRQELAPHLVRQRQLVHLVHLGKDNGLI